MTLAAGGIEIAGGKQRLLPGLGGVVGLVARGGHALATMAQHAAELVDFVRYRRMFAEGLAGRAHQKSGFVHVTGFAAVGHAEFGHPCLARRAVTAAGPTAMT